MTEQIKLVDQQVKFDENSDGLVIERYQAIPQTFLDDLKDQRFQNKSQRTGEMHQVASIPVAVVEKWMREGKDFQNASIKEILGWLRAEHLDAFITSDKY